MNSSSRADAGDRSVSARLPRPLVRHAIGRDQKSLETMFQQFLPEKEQIVRTEYLGLRGLWHIGMHSFACITTRRICALEVGWLGRVEYADAFLEDCNSGMVIQPSLIPLYIIGCMWLAMTWMAGIVLLPLIVRIYFRYVKSGATVFVKEGNNLEIFADRKDIRRINQIWRLVGDLRDQRIACILGNQDDVGEPASGVLKRSA
jgi:hypothetical protein